MGTNPLDALIPKPDEATHPEVPNMSPGTGATARTVKLTVAVDAEVAEEARNAVVFLTPQTGLTLTELVEAAITRELARLKTEHNEGQDFPPRPKRALPTGPRFR